MPSVCLKGAINGLMHRTRNVFSFDHPVGADQQPCRHRKAKRLGSLEVDHQFELGRLLNRQVGRSGTFQNTIDQLCGALVVIKKSGP